MNTKYFYYYKPKVFFVAAFLYLADAGLVCGTLSSNDGAKLAFGFFLTVFAAITAILTNDALIPALRNKAVVMADEEGLTDIISWGLIEWKNIKGMRTALVKGEEHSFTVLYIQLKDINAYEGYQKSGWIRLKIKFIRLSTGREADIRIDIDALDGDVKNVYNAIRTAWLQYRK